MKRLLTLVALLFSLGSQAAELPRAAGAAQGSVGKIKPADAAKRVAEDGAILVDVREPAEWDGGVAAPAKLLSLSQLREGDPAWVEFLAGLPENAEVIVYCRSGARSGRAAALLADLGYRVLNAGGFADWVAAGLPVTERPDETKP